MINLPFPKGNNNPNVYNNNEVTISPPGIYSAGGALFCNLAIPAEVADTLPIGHGHESQANQLLHQQQQQ